MATKADMTAYLTEHGLVVEGDEKATELAEAVGYMKAYFKTRSQT